MKKLIACDICGEGYLHPATDRYMAEYKGASQNVLRHHHKCDVCNGDYALPGDMRENKREIIRFHKAVDAIPMGCEIRAMRLSSGLSQQEAGNLFGGGPTAFSKYETDDLVPSDAMVNLLKLAIIDPSLVRRLRALKGVHLRATVHSNAVISKVGAMEWQSGGGVAQGASIFEGAVSTQGSYELENSWTQ